MYLLDDLDPLAAGLLLAGVAVGLTLVIVATVQIRRAIQRGAGARFGFGIAIAVAAGVAVIGGVTSFDAVRARFDSALIPLVADGMVIACTALRLAAMSRHWRIPGALLTTWLFIAGSVVINMASAEGWAAKLGHALAPLAYAVLVEMLAYLLRLQMRLAQPQGTQFSLITWISSPIVTTRAWLHLARTNGTDPTAARTLVRQLARMSSRLHSVCPNPSWIPISRAHFARSAALQAVRDGLLTAKDLAALLPNDRELSPGDLLALVDQAVLGTPTRSKPVRNQREQAQPRSLTSTTLQPPQPAATAERAPSQAARPAGRRRRGPSEKQRAGRAYWDRELASGRTPTGTEVAKAAGVDPTLACRWIREWKAEDMQAENQAA